MLKDSGIEDGEDGAIEEDIFHGANGIFHGGEDISGGGNHFMTLLIMSKYNII